MTMCLERRGSNLWLMSDISLDSTWLRSDWIFRSRGLHIISAIFSFSSLVTPYSCMYANTYKHTCMYIHVNTVALPKAMNSTKVLNPQHLYIYFSLTMNYEHNACMYTFSSTCMHTLYSAKGWEYNCPIYMFLLMHMLFCFVTYLWDDNVC